ncbi:hypothetical protein K7X08_028975 [Anisodus acutangulus]|uniref:Uncharacterized protein n=1 Tax=Anisodus acutangulus TaxID=402998 RepID=A0A9Q1L240_9SOLA|nr:hypothetical protein K7X08_028975 [Anisodus acutangulus]
MLFVYALSWSFGYYFELEYSLSVLVPLKSRLLTLAHKFSEFPGMTNVKCHEKFKRCIKKVQKSGKVGFSRYCPYDVAVPTMVQGMDMAIMFSQLGNSKLEL